MLDQIDISPPTGAQISYARKIAVRLGAPIPWEAQVDRRSLSTWIDGHQAAFRERVQATRGPGATSKQVAFAERIARAKRRAVPDECFCDSGLMSRWIDANR